MKIKKILFLFSSLFISLFMLMGCANSQTPKAEPVAKDINEALMQIEVKANSNTIVYQLNNSLAAKALYDQLPLSIAVQDFSTNEKIFYPPKKLPTQNTPLANGTVGTLAYYAPWGDVVMFYDSYGPNNSLYELGHIVSGEKYVSAMSGTITISKKSEP